MNGCDTCKERIARTGSAVEGVWEGRDSGAWVWYDTHHNLDCEIWRGSLYESDCFLLKCEFDYGSAETEFTGTLEQAKRFAVAFTVGCANARVDARRSARSS